MIMRLISASLAVLTVLALPLAATAQGLVLRGDVIVYNTIASVGDFFENAGPNAGTPLFRSPDIGHRGTVPVWQIGERMSGLGLTGYDSRGLTSVNVTRASQYLTGVDFLAMAKAALADQMGGIALIDLDVQVDSLPDPLHADAGAQEPVALRRLNYSNRSGRFIAQFSVDTGTRLQEVALRGVARETRMVVVLNRPVGRGDLILAEDVTETRLNVQNVSERSALSPDQLIGMEARRNLRENTAVNTSDVEPPVLVERNQAVTITYKTPTMILTSRGRALTAGSRNDLINILNLQSNRIVQGRVEGRGEILVMPRSLQLVAAKE